MNQDLYDLNRKLVKLDESILGSSKPYREPKVLKATEKMKSTGPILGGNPNKRQKPLDKKFVGCSKTVDTDKEILDEKSADDTLLKSKGLKNESWASRFNATQDNYGENLNEAMLPDVLAEMAVDAMWKLISKKRKDYKATPEAVYAAADKIAAKFYNQLGFKKPWEAVNPLVRTFLHHPKGLSLNESFATPMPIRSMLNASMPNVNIGDIIDLRKPTDMHGKVYKIDTDDDHDETIIYFKDTKTNKKYKTNIGNVLVKHNQVTEGSSKDIAKSGFIPYYFQDGQIYMLFCLSSNPKYGGDKFMIGKGHVDKGENIKQAGLREASEELGLKPSNLKMETIKIGWSGNVKGMTEKSSLNIFIGEIKNPKDFSKPDFETAQTKWMTPEEFAGVGRADQKHIVKACAEVITQTVI